MKAFIETERLLLREIVPSDAEEMFKLDTDPEVHTYLGKSPIKSMQQAKTNITFIRNQYIANGIGRWAVIEKRTKSFIGWAGLKFINEPINEKTKYYDLGYRLIKKYWGKGYASEAAKAALAYGFENLELTEIYGMVQTENLASINILEKIGLRRLETFNYENELHHLFKIKKEEWVNDKI
jgi:ribosomal-protein-alanine N-acetyltransferase